MRFLTLVVIVVALFAGHSHAQLFRRRKAPEWPKTEKDLLYRTLTCLKTRDTAAYYAQFPPFDSLWHMVMHNSDHSPETQRELAQLKEHPQTLIEFDPLYNKDIIGSFAHVLQKGEDSGVLWETILMARFELMQAEPRKNLIGYEHIAPERFRGYMFLNDRYNRLTYCVSVAEIQKIKGRFFGGQVHNILKAKTIEEFHRKEQQELEWFEWCAAHPDSVRAMNAKKKKRDSTEMEEIDEDNFLSLSRDDMDEDDENLRRIVTERHYYEGLLDNEIPFRLYVRYFKTPPGAPPLFDGLYKLGDSRRYLRLEISKREDGKWIIEDENAAGTMELVLNGNDYKGAWMNADDNGYDVTAHHTPMPPGKMETLDDILDNDASPRVDESQFEKDGEGKVRKHKRRKADKVDKEDDDKKKKREEEKIRRRHDRKARRRSDE